MLAKDSNDFGQAIPILAAFSRYAANTTGSGAFVDVAVPTLLVPDNLAVQCSAPGPIRAATPRWGVGHETSVSTRLATVSGSARS